MPCCNEKPQRNIILIYKTNNIKLHAVFNSFNQNKNNHSNLYIPSSSDKMKMNNKDLHKVFCVILIFKTLYFRIRIKMALFSSLVKTTVVKQDTSRKLFDGKINKKLNYFCFSDFSIDT